MVPWLLVSVLSTSLVWQSVNAGWRDCKTRCTKRYCESEPFEHREAECASFFKHVDPFQCGSPSCQSVMCSDCGTKEYCTELCLAWKVEHGLSYDDFPECGLECEQASDRNYVCFNPCVPESFDEPVCESRNCTGQLCMVHPLTECSGWRQIVDPGSCFDNDDHCRLSNCKRCGNHEKCLLLCKRHKRKFSVTDLDCAGVCRKPEGFKCFESCGIDKNTGELVFDDGDEFDQWYAETMGEESIYDPFLMPDEIDTEADEVIDGDEEAKEAKEAKQDRIDALNANKKSKLQRWKSVQNRKGVWIACATGVLLTAILFVIRHCYKASRVDYTAIPDMYKLTSMGIQQYTS